MSRFSSLEQAQAGSVCCFGGGMFFSGNSLKAVLIFSKK